MLSTVEYPVNTMIFKNNQILAQLLGIGKEKSIKFKET